MNKQSGISTLRIVLAVVVAAAAGSGFYVWHEHQQLMQAQRELADTKSALDKATAQARAAKDEAAAARKELEEQKATLAQLKTDRDTAVAFLESEKAHSARLQAELTTTREQLAVLRSRSVPYAQPTLAPQPRAVPVLGGRGAAVSAARPARATEPSIDPQPVSK
jgi:septal ring factor EnvC (AmiA/AmiB activator)